jgi:predicted metal-dependent enzyme (double-stranded beta helix superfamily)
MSEIATWLHDRLAPGADLDRPRLAHLAQEIVDAEQLWRPFVRHDTDERFYQQLYRDPNLDVWLICWVRGQNTGYHDHDRSYGAVCICEGTLLEDWFRVEEDGWVREQTREHAPGEGFDFDASDIHGVRHPGGDAPPATSIHVYSPALWRMGHYEPGPRGMRRIGMTYADELLGVA